MSHAMQITPKPTAIRAVYCTAPVHIHRPLRCLYRGEIAVTDTRFIPHFCGATAFGTVLPFSASRISLDQNGQRCRKGFEAKMQIASGSARQNGD